MDRVHRDANPTALPAAGDAVAVSLIALCAQPARSLIRTGCTMRMHRGSYFDPTKNLFSLSFAHPQDFTSKGAWSSLNFYADRRLATIIRADGGLDKGGAHNWLMALHMAQVGGLPYRIFVSLLGLLITGLAVTGVIIWMKKRSARLLRYKLSFKRSVVGAQSSQSIPSAIME